MGTKPIVDGFEKEVMQKPGPGQYDPKVHVALKSSPSAKIGTAQRDDLTFKKQIEFKPPPTVYNPTDSFTKTASAAWGFGTSGRPPLNDNRKATIPGPNQYAIGSVIGNDGPKYVMGIKIRDQINDFKEKIPGPGQYEVFNMTHSRIKREPAFSVGTGKRQDIAGLKHKQDMPGPGNYSVLDDSTVKRNAPKYGFGTGKRDDSNEKSKTNLVGPGAYEIKLVIGAEGRKNSISPKLNDNFKERESRNKPGPGSYDTLTQSASNLKAAPAYKIGTSKRNDSVPRDRMHVPDATVYNPNDSFTKTQSAAFGFGTSLRKSLDGGEKKPGPGAYELPSKAFDRPRFAMGVKCSDLSKFSTPGPGNYEAKVEPVKKAMPAFS